MEIKKQKNRKRALIASLAVFFVILLAVTYHYYGMGGNLFGRNPAPVNSTSLNESDMDSNKIDLNQPTEDQVRAGNETKSSSVKNDPQSTDSTRVNSGVKVTAVATTNNGTLRIQTTIDKVTNSGTCALTLSKDGVSKKYSAGVQAITDYSTCKGFDIPLSSLSSGKWKIDIKYKNASSEGIASTSITL